MSAPEQFIAQLEACLPQTQCTRCGYPHCRAYAAALAHGETAPNRCPPGGDTTIRLLAAVLGTAEQPLDPACGAHTPRVHAVIDEANCIGCRKCIDACPVDAIVGARKLLHTVLVTDCTGCELCLPPCPVDCITLVPAAPPVATGPWPDYARAETGSWQQLADARRLRRTAPKRTRRRSIFPDRATIRRDLAAALERSKKKKIRQD